jgi:hypothetical protein
MIDLDYLTFQTEWIVAQCTVVGCWIANSNEILLIGKAGLENIDMAHLCPNVPTFIILNTPLMQVYLSNQNH